MQVYAMMNTTKKLSVLRPFYRLEKPIRVQGESR